MVSDGVALTNASFSSTSFAIGETVDRRAQLPRQRDHLPGGRQDRGERPRRHQDHDPDRRGAAARRRPARLARVRDPALGEQRRPQGPVAQAVPPPADAARTGTTSARCRSTWSSRGSGSTSRCCSGSPPSTSTSPTGLGARRSARSSPRCSTSSGRSWSSAPPPASAGCSRSSARSTSRTSGGTSGSGSSAPSRRCSTGRRSRRSRGGCSACGSVGGLRRRLRHRGEDARPHRRRLHDQRRRLTAGPLDGGRDLQVRPHRRRLRRHARRRVVHPLRRHDRRRRGARARLVPHEGRPRCRPRARWQGNPAREVAVAEAPKVRMRI